SINGRVADASGMELIGATVLAIHTPSGSQYGTTTNEVGYFTIQGMRVGGPYTVEVSYTGFQTVKEEGIYLNLGSPAILNFSLSEQAVVLGEVVVAASKDSRFADGKTG